MRFTRLLSSLFLVALAALAALAAGCSESEPEPGAPAAELARGFIPADRVAGPSTPLHSVARPPALPVALDPARLAPDQPENVVVVTSEGTNP